MARFGVVELRVEQKLGITYVSSDDLPGLHLCGPDAKAVLADVPAAIEFLGKLNKQASIRVAWAQQAHASSRKTKRLVTFPAELAAA